MFSRYHSIDDVRALCIAAFWLSDVSWKLSGHAIRVATELDVHNAFYKALEGDREAFLRARLWYMLYVCDHHFSIAYGRPPMISESLQIREHEQFLKLPFADALDYRILSQVALFQIMTRIHDSFAEIRLPQQDSIRAVLSQQHFPQMRRFNVDIDHWRIKWESLQRHNNFIGTFPPKGIVLYSYFAKLQLNSFAIRGISTSEEAMSTERKEFVDAAISSATSVLNFVQEEADIRRALVGTPLYVHTMIAFACVFLMNVATIRSSGAALGRHFSIDPQQVWSNVEAMVKLLQSLVVSDRHLIQHLAAGLEKMLLKARQVAGSGFTSRSMSNEGTMEPPIAAKSVAATLQQQQRVWNSNGMEWSNETAANSRISDHDGFVADEEMIFMNDSLLYDVFGTETTNEVYNLLSNQFSY